LQAEKEAASILKAAEVEASKVKSVSGKNSFKAVEFILKQLGG